MSLECGLAGIMRVTSSALVFVSSSSLLRCIMGTASSWAHSHHDVLPLYRPKAMRSSDDGAEPPNHTAFCFLNCSSQVFVTVMES